MNVRSFLERMRRHPDYKDQIVHIEELLAREPEFAELSPPLPQRLSDSLKTQGISRLYKHQVDAIDAARAGNHTVVVTPTASGKSLCYNAPTLETMLLEPQARALYLFPTKALAQDQQAKLAALNLWPDVVSATYDGDTPRDERSAIKRTARLIVTNPDMLHMGILPYHASWATLFRNLRYVVVDEAHVYRGVFGAHVGNILRRLRRVAEMYGARPQFLACSATIANPAELIERLTGLSPVCVDADGAPRGAKHFVFWNPPIHDPATGARRSTNSEATTLFTTLVGSGVRTIAFTRARRTAELLLAYARRAFESTSSQQHLAGKIISYRAGYTVEQRREIERRLFDGDLTGVTATNALELGVDIGGIDASILTGYPGTVASMWQQAGRAGRRNGESLAVLIAADNPLDQFLMKRPGYFFGKPSERAALDPLNRHILSGHLLCAAYERPLDDDDLAHFGELLDDGENRVRWTAHQLVESEHLAIRGDRFYYAGGDYPASLVNIRTAGADTFTIQLGGKTLGTVEASRAFETIHPGAVYLHLGESYVVNDLDLVAKRASVSAAPMTCLTEPRTESWIEISAIHAQRTFGEQTAFFGEVVVTSQVVGYRQKQLFTDEVLGVFDLDLPEQRFATEAVWYALSPSLLAELAVAGLDLAGGVHAVEHASIGLLPLFALCDRNDIGGVSTPFHPQVELILPDISPQIGAPAIFVHDAHPGGVGIAEAGYRSIEAWLLATKTAIDECPCDDGCPSCIQSPKCGNNNEPLDKKAASMILRHLLGG